MRKREKREGEGETGEDNGERKLSARELKIKRGESER